MKLAYFSPLNPQHSGISDYSEELLMHLRHYMEIDLFTDGFTPVNALVTTNFRVLDYKTNPSVLELLTRYDAIIYHIGNDYRYHSGIHKVMRRYPGIVVFHDFALQDFFLGLAQAEGRFEIYLDELEASHGKLERARADENHRRGLLPPHIAAPLDFPLNTRMASSADGIIVHSEWGRKRLSAIAPGVPIAHIKHHITAEAANAPASKRNVKPNSAIKIGSFGMITPDKAIHRALSALSALKHDNNFHYTLVGSANTFPELQELINTYGLKDHVTITGYVSLEEFQRLILETDIAINLRERPVGATSGSLCRIMAAGIPAIVSNVGGFSELPDYTVIKIDHDRHCHELLQAYLRELITNPLLRARIGANAREYVLAEHKIENSAAKYAAFVREVIARRPRLHVVNSVAKEMAQLGIGSLDESLILAIASETSVLVPDVLVTPPDALVPNSTLSGPRSNDIEPKDLLSDDPQSTTSEEAEYSPGRMPKVEGIDYKSGAIEYSQLLNPELSYYLRTKPFCNLHKPIKYSGDGMDPETHRHFTDFANLAVTLALPANSRILDVGCGPGWLSEYFARLGYEVTGIDISEDLIQVARERLAGVPYQVDQETPLKCRFLSHDIESAPLAEKFDAIICYDALHHFEDEHNVFANLAEMLHQGGVLFILEGKMPAAGSATEEELRGFMKEYKTLESPFSEAYLHQLLCENGFAVTGNYVSVNGFFEREMLEGNDNLQLPLKTIDTAYHYLTCMKVSHEAPATSVPDSRSPSILQAQFTLHNSIPPSVNPGSTIQLVLTIKNKGNTLWLSGQTVRAGLVMPGVKILDQNDQLISEAHGPLMRRSVPPQHSISINVQFEAPGEPGVYTAKVDLVDQCICWFEEKGSEPLRFSFNVESPQ